MVINYFIFILDQKINITLICDILCQKSDKIICEKMQKKKIYIGIYNISGNYYTFLL